MKVEPSGVVMIGECDIRLPQCTATIPAPITAVFTSPNRKQVDVCRVCLENMIRDGEWEIAGARLNQHIDIAGYDARGTLQLIVEVRGRLNRQKPDVTQATRIHGNLVTHSAVPRSRFFLLAFFPRPFYLWVDETSAAPDSPPDYKFDVENDLLHYMIPAGTVTFEATDYSTAVEAWLTNVVRSGTPPDGQGSEWLFASGLHAALEGGTIIGQATDDLRLLSKSA